LIKDQIGLDLQLSDVKGKGFFNVNLSHNVFSDDYNKLKRFADKYNLIRIQPNGNNRVAIFLL